MSNYDVSQCTLHLGEMRLSTRLGWTAEERMYPQVVKCKANLVLVPDINDDDLDTTVSYDLLSQDLAEYLATGQWRLLEALARDASAFLIRYSPRVMSVECTITKDVFPLCDGVGVTWYTESKSGIDIEP